LPEPETRRAVVRPGGRQAPGAKSWSARPGPERRPRGRRGPVSGRRPRRHCLPPRPDTASAGAYADGASSLGESWPPLALRASSFACTCRTAIGPGTPPGAPARLRVFLSRAEPYPSAPAQTTFGSRCGAGRLSVKTPLGTTQRITRASAAKPIHRQHRATPPPPPLGGVPTAVDLAVPPFRGPVQHATGPGAQKRFDRVVPASAEAKPPLGHVKSECGGYPLATYRPASASSRPLHAPLTANRSAGAS